MDTGYDKDGDLLANNIRSLGLDPAKIKVILLTHAHADHAGGAARLAKMTGAGVMIHEKDADVVETGTYKGKPVNIPLVKVDRKLKDGEIVTHGGVAFKTVFCPGQSMGEVVFLATVNGPEGPCRVCFGGDATGFKNDVTTLERLGYPGVCADYRRTVETCAAETRVQFVPGGAHPHQVFKECNVGGWESVHTRGKNG